VLARKSEELQTLLDISMSLQQYRYIDDLIMYIIHRIAEAMLVEAVSVILYDKRKGDFVFCWSSDVPDRAQRLNEIRFPANQGIAGSVFQNDKAEIILDVENDSRHYMGVDSTTEFKTKSMIAVPLRTKEDKIGVLEVLNKKQSPFDKQDLNFLLTLAPIIAMALENARMYTELDKAYRKLQIINKNKSALIKQTQDEVAFLRREVERHYRFDQIVGNSEPILELFRLCEKVIDSDITVLIQGETGTGKELIARTIHYNGPLKNRPFVTQNCGGIPDTLLASELFGHRKGAFTGAVSNKKGLFEIAHGGSVFLDEVGEMSSAMQTSLLRVLQDGEIRPLGAERSKKVNARVISATNRNLEHELADGRLREDLFYRLSVFTIKVPPLRERTGDIPILANHFIRKYNEKANRSIEGLSLAAMECLATYPFPGNVRELENEIERAMAMARDSKIIEIYHLSEKMRKKSGIAGPTLPVEGGLKQMVEALERSVLTEMLEKQRGNKTKIARELGLSRHGLRKKMERYGL
jgi:Nif-specific regulatory protein